MVVPVEEAAAPTAGVGQTAEPLRVVRPVLERLELRLGVRVVVGKARAK